MFWIKLLIALVGIGMIGSALFALAVLWPFILIFYGLVLGGFLVRVATEIG